MILVKRPPPGARWCRRFPFAAADCQCRLRPQVGTAAVGGHFSELNAARALTSQSGQSSLLPVSLSLSWDRPVYNFPPSSLPEPPPCGCDGPLVVSAASPCITHRCLLPRSPPSSTTTANLSQTHPRTSGCVGIASVLTALRAPAGPPRLRLPDVTRSPSTAAAAAAGSAHLRTAIPLNSHRPFPLVKLRQIRDLRPCSRARAGSNSSRCGDRRRGVHLVHL